MITASKPLEFIPRGRKAVEKHPGPFSQKKQTNVSTEVLLHRLQNFNISDAAGSSEFWSINELIEYIHDYPKQDECPGLFYNFCYNSEEELYVKGNTAVWSQGSIKSKTCFTCNTQIKFAFFCSSDFSNPNKKDQIINLKDKSKNNICLIDSTTLRVFDENGENFITTLEFPISNVWLTKYGIIFEKDAINSLLDSQTIPLPRLFSLTHPLDEISPVLIKTSNGIVQYLTEVEYKIIFTTISNDLILLYDIKSSKHSVYRIRKATSDEIQAGGFSESNLNFTDNLDINSILHSQTGKFSGTGKSIWNNATHTPYSMKLSSTQSNLFHNSIGNLNQTQSHLAARLQSTLGVSMSMQDVRKIGQVTPSKPIVPEFCLEFIWTEEFNSGEYCEHATNGFLHTDFIGDSYLCYLLPRTCKLNLVKINYDTTKHETFGAIVKISAKDAICLKNMNIIVILDLFGTVVLYSGTSIIGKIYVGGILSSLTTSSNLSSSFISTFPRRSSLLPTVAVTPETKFEDELHLLSPVHPLQSNNLTKNGQCIGLKDPAGNRLNLIYPGGKLFRFSIPPLCENYLILKCLFTLRQILPRKLALDVLVKWYGVRNAPGTQDYSPQQEWDMFQRFLLDLIDRSWTLHLCSRDNSASPSEEPSKRRKNDNSNGSNNDWNFLLSYKNKNYNYKNNSEKLKSQNTNNLMNDDAVILLPYIYLIMFSFHLIYEELKLDGTMKFSLELLSNFLYRLSLMLGLSTYGSHYFTDFPKLAAIPQLSGGIFKNDKLIFFEHLKGDIPNIFKFIDELINGSKSQYPFIVGCNEKSRNLIKIFSIIFSKNKQNIKICETAQSKEKKSNKSNNENNLLKYLLELPLTRLDLQKLPLSLYYIIAQKLEEIRINAPIGCSPETYELLLRPELVAHATFTNEKRKSFDIQTSIQKENSLSPRIASIPDVIPKPESINDEDGMANIDTKLLRLRFSKDLRINDVRNFLNSSTPVPIDMVQAPNVSDHEFIEEQEKYLYALSTRTMALPLGRGMLTLRTSTPASTESLPIPRLCLAGKESVRGTSIEIQQIEVPPNMNMWPLFHNGVAAGLRVTSDSKDIDSTWIVYNKPKGNTDVPTEHAGFLMALGLNGHLKTLSFMSIYEYLVKCDEMTSLGLLLGISITHRGTMDLTTTKLLSIHVEALLPPTALELDIPQNIQIASLMGVGLLYQGSAKRHIAEILLEEIGRPPGPEMENSVERESYALTTGLALGLVALGQGESSPGLRDLQLTDTLHYYMTGGNKRPLVGSQKEKYKLPSFQIREGHVVNIDVTAPGAILALGLMFFKTNNLAVSNWMEAPDTRYLLNFVRPDLLLLRMIAKGLILWDSIEPTFEWIFSQYPQSLRFDIKNGPIIKDKTDKIDHEANCQAYCNIITGAAFCVGLRYAGTENDIAYHTLKKIIKLFLCTNGQYIGKFAGNSTIESCLVSVLLSLSLIFAGTGNLSIIRMIRMMRNRIGPSNYHVTYGSHMAIHMALGFLFLGAGRYTLSRSPQAIAALVCALFPKFPTHSNDNRYHLQAFRHLYVLAVEPRILIPRDIDTGKLNLCRVSCITINSKELRELGTAPCMLPELDTIEEICIDDPYFWKISFKKENNWNQLIEHLNRCACIDLKQKAGYLYSLEDTRNCKVLLESSIKLYQNFYWKVEIENLTFSNDSLIMSLVSNMFSKSISNDDENEQFNINEYAEAELQRNLLLHLNNSNKIHGFSIYMGLLMAWENLKIEANTEDIWQFKIIKSALKNFNEFTLDNILPREILLSLIMKLESMVQDIEETEHTLINRYLLSTNVYQFQNVNIETLKKILLVVTFNNIMPVTFLNDIGESGGNKPNNLSKIAKIKLKGVNPQFWRYAQQFLFRQKKI